MGYSPWGHKELDTTERLNNKNSNGGVRGCAEFPSVQHKRQVSGLRIGTARRKSCSFMCYSSACVSAVKAICMLCVIVTEAIVLTNQQKLR